MCCSFGDINKNLIYICLSTISNIINSCFYGLNNNEVFKSLKFFAGNNLSDHILIRFFFNYLFIIIGSICLDLYDCYINKKCKLFHYNVGNIINIETKKLVLISLLIYLIWLIEELCLECFIVPLKDVDWWMVELIFLTILTKLIFKIEIYPHQLIAICISFISLGLKVASIFITFLYGKKDSLYERNKPILYRIKPVYLAGVLLYLIFIFLRASVNSGLK